MKSIGARCEKRCEERCEERARSNDNKRSARIANAGCVLNGRACLRACALTHASLPSLRAVDARFSARKPERKMENVLWDVFLMEKTGERYAETARVIASTRLESPLPFPNLSFLTLRFNYDDPSLRLCLVDCFILNRRRLSTIVDD